MPIEPRPRRNYAVGLERRELILETATTEFASHGYRGTAIAQIADKVGLTQAGLLHYFRSKPELLIAVLERRDEQDIDNLKLLDFTQPWGRGVEALNRLVSLMELNSKRHGIVQLFTVITGESVTDSHPAKAWAQERYAMVRGSILTSLQLGVEDGTVRADADLEEAATKVVAVMDGLQIQWLHDPSIDMVGIFRRYVETVSAELAL